MRIRYVGIDGGATRLTLDEFLQFSPRVRAVLVCEELVTFFDHRGRRVRTQQALNELACTWGSEDLGQAPTRPARPKRRKTVEDDRRRHRRHSMVVPVSISCADGVEVGFTENISQGGALFRSEIRLRAGQRLQLRIPVAGVADAVVVRSFADEDACLTAVAFVHERARAA